LAIAFSTYFSGVLSFLIGMLLFVCGFFKEFIIDLAFGRNLGGGPMESLARLAKGSQPTAELDPSSTVKTLQAVDSGYRWVWRRVFSIVPDVEHYGVSDYVAQGFNIGPDLMLVNLVLLAGYVLPWLVAAYYLMKVREIAA
jgi:hypothetical protein